MRDREGEKVRKRIRKTEGERVMKVVRKTEIRHRQSQTERKIDTEIEREILRERLRYKHREVDTYRNKYIKIHQNAFNAKTDRYICKIYNSNMT